MSEFTKGPWKLKPAGNQHYVGKIEGRDYEATMQRCYLLEGDEHDPDVDTFVADVIIDPRMEANAHLIAASPIMFKYIKTKADSGDEEAIKIISEITLD